jgi:hypothetical protein
VGAGRAPQPVKGHSWHPRRALGHQAPPSSRANVVLAWSPNGPQQSRRSVLGDQGSALPKALTGRDPRTAAGEPRVRGPQLLEPRDRSRRPGSNTCDRGVQHPRVPLTLSALLGQRLRALALLPNCGASGRTAILGGLAWVWAAPNYWPPGTLGREGAGIGMRVREVVTTVG